MADIAERGRATQLKRPSRTPSGRAGRGNSKEVPLFQANFGKMAKQILPSPLISVEILDTAAKRSFKPESRAAAATRVGEDYWIAPLSPPLPLPLRELMPAK